MNQNNFIRVSWGAMAVCLLLVGVLRPWTAVRPAVLAHGAGDGSGDVYLPLIMRVPSPMSTTTPTATSTLMSTNTPTATTTATATGVPTEAFTPTNMPTATNTPIPTNTSTATATNPPTPTDTPTPTYTPTPTATTTFTTTRVSVASDGMEGNNDSIEPAISADGRYIAFRSWATNLVNGDSNGWEDIFIHDKQTGQTSRVSIASDGTQANETSLVPTISADGRYVGFVSWADNLVNGDTNNQGDVFIHDRQTGETSRVSVASGGTQGNGTSGTPSISADGRYIAFSSNSSNLVSGDTNNVTDIFVHDRQTGQTSRVSIASNGTQSNNGSGGSSISADGRYVAFSSSASNLVSGDTNNFWDIFIHDQQTGQTRRASIASDGTEGNGRSDFPAISADGRYIAFSSLASNMVGDDTNGADDAFVHDRQTGETSRVSVASDGSQGNNFSFCFSISADGRYVAFQSAASNLVNGDTNGYDDAFVHDRQMGLTSRVSISSEGTEGNSHSWFASLSGDGRYLAFQSDANNLVNGDTNGEWDVFVHDRGE